MEKLSPNNFVETFDLNPEPLEDQAPITVWIPVEHKAKYDLLQSRSRRKFGKFLREIIKKSIDRVDAGLEE